ncbi:MAG: energy-coupling factor transporter transmembrane component T family protein [Eubacterium sp.]|jgi:energy-coupling factor transport system permease protein
MLRDITLGQYYPGKSAIHELDPRTKIISTLLFIIELFLVRDFTGLAVAACALAAVIVVSRVPFSFIVRGLKPIVIIIIITFALNVFMSQGTIIWQWKFLHVTYEGLRSGIFVSVRLILLIISSTMLTLTTTPITLTDGLEKLMSPLSHIGVPAHEIAMMMSISLRFIPTLMEETDKIIKAQEARGADFESGNLLRRAKAMVPILVPLFVSSFHIAQDLANAMESRCYRGGKGRTRMNQITFDKSDVIAFIFMIAFLAVVIVMRSYSHILF